MCDVGQNYNQTRHDHEIMLETQTQIQEVQDDDKDQVSIPKMLYNVGSHLLSHACTSHNHFWLVHALSFTCTWMQPVGYNAAEPDKATQLGVAVNTDHVWPLSSKRMHGPSLSHHA